MIFGNDKYECFQDVTPYRLFLIRFVSAAIEHMLLNGLLFQHPSDALKLLGIDIPFEEANFPDIMLKLNEMLKEMPPEGTPPYIPVNERVFLLRSADPLGPSAAQHWVAEATKAAVSAKRITSATEQIAAMQEYRKTHLCD